jgi:hypothetical protein
MSEERELIQDALQWPEHLEQMRVLIAVPSCWRDRDTHQVIRDTWKKDSPVHVHFFMGRGNTPHFSDETVLDVPDDWDGLPRKTQAICRWAVEKDFDFIFKADTDSYVSIPRLLASGFEKYHYSGCCGEKPNEYPDSCFPANGGGYWLSRRAFEYLAENMNLGLGKNCEDWCVFLSLMKGAGIFVHHDPRYAANRAIPGQAPAPGNDFIILHDAGENSLRNPEKMIEAHEQAQGVCVS